MVWPLTRLVLVRRMRGNEGAFLLVPGSAGAVGLTFACFAVSLIPFVPPMLFFRVREFRVLELGSTVSMVAGIGVLALVRRW